MAVTFCDESESVLGWISHEPAWMGRASHTLASGGGVWLIDPVDFDGLDERVGSLGEPRAVLQLLDRHDRDCARVAARLSIPLLVAPLEVPGSPFEAIRIKALPRWRETALWWPEQGTLIVADAVGTVPYYCAPGSPLGVNPVLRLFRPPVALLGLDPDHILCGHGRGIHDGAAAALDDAVRRSRRDLPAVLRRVARARKQRVV